MVVAVLLAVLANEEKHTFARTATSRRLEGTANGAATGTEEPEGF